MAQKRSSLSTLLVLAALFAGVWLYFTPYLAMNKLQKAARQGDEQAMAELVDFPSLRESVKGNVRSAVEHSVGRERNPLGMLGGILAGAVAGPVVDAVVTPQGIAALTEGERPGQRRGSDGDSRVRVKNVKVKRGYEGFDLFVVHFVSKDDGHERMALLMRREGIARWRLSGVRIPGVADERAGD
ncbi:MAG TPA: DUF2939 domain-containing protein [Longimicrobium sp.]|jgi:hypothetical protein|nr:DUF2939 domain-containing protein [Longimicrobium sp.]